MDLMHCIVINAENSCNYRGPVVHVIFVPYVYRAIFYFIKHNAISRTRLKANIVNCAFATLFPTTEIAMRGNNRIIHIVRNKFLSVKIEGLVISKDCKIIKHGLDHAIEVPTFINTLYICDIK